MEGDRARFWSRSPSVLSVSFEDLYDPEERLDDADDEESGSEIDVNTERNNSVADQIITDMDSWTSFEYWDDDIEQLP